MTIQVTKTAAPKVDGCGVKKGELMIREISYLSDAIQSCKGR